MKPVPLGCLMLLLATDAGAHRLDEYLQATRISVASNRIDLTIDLTPGVAVADQVLALIDQDRDGTVSKAEGATYAGRVLKDLQVQLDEKRFAPKLVDISFPAIIELQSGVGVIRIKATMPIGQLTVGNHVLNVSNVHLPAISAYLVNALVPKESAIQIKKQTRDEVQRDYRLEFSVSP